MSTDVDSNPMTDDLLLARINWVEARQRREVRDDHCNRVAEAAAWGQVEAVLDAYRDSRGDCE